MTITNSKVTGNSASCAYAKCVAQGGIYNQGIPTVQNSQVNGNTASGTGSPRTAQADCIYNDTTSTPAGSVSLVNSQVSKNKPDNCFLEGTIAGCKN